jgi:hypothetical protein
MADLYRMAADAVVLLHVVFVVFVVFGGLLALRWPWVIWAHVPAAIWGVAIEFAGWICPLTPLEIYLRQQGGAAVYQGDFIEHYLLPMLYPPGLTRAAQWTLGMFALAINALIYGLVFLRRARDSSD